MCDNYGKCLVIGNPVFLGVTPYHRPRIEGMAECPARELRKSPDLCLRQHFIRHRRVGDISMAFPLYAFSFPVLIDFGGDVGCKQPAQIAGVHTIAAFNEGLLHDIRDLVNSGPDRCDQTGP